MTKQKILLIISICIVFALSSCSSSSSDDSILHGFTIDLPEVGNFDSNKPFVPDYSSGKENIRGNTVNMLQNKGCFAVQDQWIYYYYKNNIYKMPIGGGKDDIYILYSNKKVKSIQVLGDWIYFLEEMANDKWHIKRIRTDGSNGEVIVDDIVTSMWRISSVEKSSTFVAFKDWLYYVSMTITQDQDANDMITYHITRSKTDGSTIENLYTLDPQKRSNKLVIPNIEFIDDDDTLYYFTINGDTQRYYYIDTNNGVPNELFSTLLRANNDNTVLFFFTLDENGGTYITGYDFFNLYENEISIKDDYAYPVYYLNGSLSSLLNGTKPVPLSNGPGLHSEESNYHLSYINNNVVTISYNPDKPSKQMYEFVRYDKQKEELIKIADINSSDATHPYPEVFADLKDSYIYFAYDMTDTMWWRIKPDGTCLEELTWMLTPLSPKKP